MFIGNLVNCLRKKLPFSLLHNSSLKSFRSITIKVHEAALAKGVKVSGATVHYVDEGMDTGEIIFQKAVDVLDGDTPVSIPSST